MSCKWCECENDGIGSHIASSLFRVLGCFGIIMMKCSVSCAVSLMSPAGYWSSLSRDDRVEDCPPMLIGHKKVGLGKTFSHISHAI